MSLNQPIKKYVLANGLTVLYEPMRMAPVVSINIGVRIGSAWENADEAGLSHLLEHMVFKGTTSYQPGEISSLVEASGGELNAYTSFDHTVYYINLSSRHLERGLNLIKEMVFDATIDEVELTREKEVVVEEISRGLDNPNSRLSETLFKTYFKKHPYGKPIIGTAEAVRGHPRDRVHGFYKKWYAPNNMVLAVYGDFDEAKLLGLIENQFGPLGSGHYLHPTLPVEPLATKPRIQVLTDEVQSNYIQIAYPATHLTHQDTPVIDLLSKLLGEGETSLLYQELKEKTALCTTIHSGAYTPYFPGVFIVGLMSPFKHSKIILDAVFNTVETARKVLFDDKQLERVKLSLKSSLYYDKETCEGAARKFLTFELTARDYRYEEAYLAAIDKITVKDVWQAAVKYLNPKHATVAVLTNQQNKKVFALPKNLVVKQAKTQWIKKLDHADASVWQLANGIRILLRTNKSIPLMSLKLASIGGLRAEPKKLNGLTHLMAGLLERGTTKHNSLELAEIYEDIAGHIKVFSGRNSWGISSTFLSGKAKYGLETFCEMLTKPAWNPKEFQKEKKLILHEIKNREDAPAQLAYLRFQEELFKNHPYGRPLIGTKASVSAIKLGDVQKFYRQSLDPTNIVISVVGDFSAEQVLAELARGLAHLPQLTRRTLRLKAEPPLKSRIETRLKKNKKQSHLVLGFSGPTLQAKDRYALEVMNGVLTGQGGRLFLELRDKKSLAYTVTSSMVQGIEPGYFAFYIGTEASKEATALGEIKNEINKLRDKKIPGHELQRSKNFLIGNYELDLQRNSAVASTLCINELFGFPVSHFRNYVDCISAVTADQVRQAAQKYLHPEHYVLSVVGP